MDVLSVVIYPSLLSLFVIGPRENQPINEWTVQTERLERAYNDCSMIWKQNALNEELLLRPSLPQTSLSLMELGEELFPPFLVFQKTIPSERPHRNTSRVNLEVGQRGRKS